MLIGNKFLFLKIPRTATVAFERSCFLANIPVEYPSLDILAQKRVKTGQESLRHYHEPLSKLREVFGETYPVIAIKRDDLDRFISAWKYTILELSYTDKNSANILKAVTTTEFIETWKNIIGYSANLKDIKIVERFFEVLIGKSLGTYRNFCMMFATIMTGPSRWHQNNQDIIYFDFKNLPLLEQYIQKEIEPSFEFIITNDTRGIKVNLEPTRELEDFYTTWIEPVYKNTNTLI